MIHKLKTTLLATIASAALVCTPAAQAQTLVEVPLFFDDFLADNGGLAKDNFRLFNLWNVTRGSVDLVGPNITDVTDDPVFGRFVDLAGSTKNPGSFITRVPLPFLAGATYRLSFRYKSTDGKPATARATIASRVYTVTTSSTEFQQFTQTFVFGVQRLARLSFQNVEGDKDNSGIGLDTVMVTQVVSFPTTDVSIFGGLGPVSVGVGVSRQ